MGKFVYVILQQDPIGHILASKYFKTCGSVHNFVTHPH